MTTRDKEIVSALHAALTERIGQDRFELWFSNGVKLQPAGEVLRVEVGDGFILERLRSRLRQDLQAACDEVFGRRLAIEFVLTEDTSEAEKPAARGAAAQGSSKRIRRGARTISIDAGHTKTASTEAAFTRATPQAMMRLDCFVRGAGNQIAYTGALRVVRQPGVVSPLFLYGSPGVGKTHLLHAIAAAIRETRVARRVVLLSAEQFAGQFLEALRGTGMPSFRRKYRDVEVLLIDDLQFLAGKRATIVEMQHTVDTLLRDGRQLVLAADRPPSELNGLGAELIARISGGLVCGIEPADRQTRLEILKRLNAQWGTKIPGEVLKLIAERMPGDARQLAGALNRLQTTSEAWGCRVTVAMAEQALEDLFRSAQRIVRLPDIAQAVCDVFGIDEKSLHSSRKSKAISQPRMLAMWLARRYTRAAYAEIGEFFGNRSHSTVISAHKRVEGWVKGNAQIELRHGPCQIQDAVRRVEARLQTG